MIDFKVKPDGADEYEVTATSRDLYLWEKTNKGKTLKSLMESLAVVDLYAVAHIASRRAGQFDGNLADFSSTTDLTFEMEEEPDPTPAAPGAAS